MKPLSVVLVLAGTSLLAQVAALTATPSQASPLAVTIPIEALAAQGDTLELSLALDAEYEKGMDDGVAALCQELGGTTHNDEYVWCEI